VGCLNTSDPGRFVFQYAVATYDCDTVCTQPGTAPLASAARGDTVWIRHEVALVQATDTVRRATIRPACGVNAVLESPAAAVDTIPTPTCGDSTASQNFPLGGSIVRYTQWVIDPALPPAVYQLVGRVMEQPRIEPRFFFTVQ
jgi:hypothetical protein